MKYNTYVFLSLCSASVRENIVFAHEFDEEYYNAVLDACELRHDLSLLGEGDMTEVGEKGEFTSNSCMTTDPDRSRYHFEWWTTCSTFTC